MNLLILLLSFVGFCISLYAFGIERQLSKDPTYKPACDISDRISCTKPIQSPYGKTFGISNALLGLAYYSLLAFFSLFGTKLLALLTTAGAFVFSIYLAYILFTKIRSMCLVCLSIYAINIALFIIALHSLR